LKNSSVNKKINDPQQQQQIMMSYWVLLLVFFLVFVNITDAMFFKSIFDNWYAAHECEGTCQLSMTCWMNGGQPAGTCGGLVYICCNYHSRNNSREGQYAEPRKLDYWDSVGTNSVEVLQDIHFGPVRNEPDCGLQKISRRRVVGGHEAGFGVFPWQALIRIRNSRCGGALVGRQHVVTAGHCVHSYAKSIDPPLGIVVYLGEYTLYTDVEPLPRQRFSVSSVHLHPYYQFTPQADRYDVAVLRLSRPVRYEPHIGPVCLPYKNEYVEEDTGAMVAGWGATKPDSTERPRNLQAVDVKIVETLRCEDWHRANGIKVIVYCLIIKRTLNF
jgi:transmembrane serine protease 6